MVYSNNSDQRASETPVINQEVVDNAASEHCNEKCGRISKSCAKAVRSSWHDLEWF